MDTKAYFKLLGEQARQASRIISAASTAEKNTALLGVAQSIQNSRSSIKSANVKDLVKGKEAGLDTALLDRLELTEERIDGILEGLEQVVALPDPVGEIEDLTFRPSGIQVGKMRMPLGVIGIIYESRPNVTVEAASLCLKSGNASILRGGSEALFSNQALAQAIADGIQTSGMNPNVVQVVETSDRSIVDQMVTAPDYIDVIVPRGGKGLIEHVSRLATVNVIKHLDGNCHVFIDDSADHETAIAIAVNAKTHRYGVCNAMETLLVHEDVAEDLLPELTEAYDEYDVELRVCERTYEILKGKVTSTLIEASEDDWYEEYLAPILAVKIVGSIDEAILHINKYSSKHTEAIVTNNYENSLRFTREVDSSSVIVNASTRFADGFEYGLGAEIGISTDKIHVRGPVGLEGLTSQKYIVLGQGQIRS